MPVPSSGAPSPTSEPVGQPLLDGVGGRILRQLEDVPGEALGAHGCRVALAHQLQVEPAVLAPLLAQLQSLDWVGLLREEGGAAEARRVLLIDPEVTLLAPLVDKLLLSQDAHASALWSATRLDQARLAEVLPRA